MDIVRSEVNGDQASFLLVGSGMDLVGAAFGNETYLIVARNDLHRFKVITDIVDLDL